MSIRLGRATIRSIVPKQKFEVFLTVFTDQAVKDVVIEENVNDYLQFLELPKDKKRIFTKVEYPELSYIPSNSARTISYIVECKIKPNQIFIDDRFNKGDLIESKPIISGFVSAKTMTGREIKSRIKNTDFSVVFPLIIPTDMEFLDDGRFAVIIRNVGQTDAKSVEIYIDIGIDLHVKQIRKFNLKIINIDMFANKYYTSIEIEEEILQSLISQDLTENIINFFSKLKKKIVENKYKQTDPISVEADRREKLIYATPISS